MSGGRKTRTTDETRDELINLGIGAGLDHAAARLRAASRSPGDAMDEAARFVDAIRNADVPR